MALFSWHSCFQKFLYGTIVTSFKMLFKSTISIALFATLVYSQAKDLNPEGVGCVDPSGYTSCYATSASKFTSCGEACINLYAQGSTDFDDCISGCSATNWATNIGCWLQTCWNQVYSCRYHGTALQYIAGTDILQTTMKNPIPYYPTPEGVPGACCAFSPLYSRLNN